MRLGFAIAAFLDADVLLLDEVFAVGDEAFQRKCFGVSRSSRSGAARSCSSPTTPPPSSVSADARCSSRTVASRSTGRCTRRSRDTAARWPRRVMRGDRGTGRADGRSWVADVRLVASPAGARTAPRRRAAGARGRRSPARGATAAPCRSARRRGPARGGGGRRHGALGWERGTAGSPAARRPDPAPAVRPLSRDARAARRRRAAAPRAHRGSSRRLSGRDSRGLVRLGGTWSAGANEDPQ